jgi:autotransporter-associated beta strand protein
MRILKKTQTVHNKTSCSLPLTSCALAVGVFLLLQGCGGGGGSSGGWVAPPPSTAVPTNPGTTPGNPTPAPTTPSPAQSIGVIDAGAYVSNPALRDTDITVYDYVGQGERLRSGLPISAPDVTQIEFENHDHGTYVSQIIAGQPVGAFGGGLVPDASLVVARVFGATGGALPDDVAAAWTGLYASGIRLFNNSLGSYGTLTPDSLVVRTMSTMIAGGSLLVFAAGNDGRSQPTSQAALGADFSNLQPGMIVAAGSNANGTALHDDSNACGVAAAYCLVAPYISGLLVNANASPATGLSYYVMAGTSGSAPLVTGTAARVWNTFPWMTANNVQQTVLTTATRLGGASGLPYNAATGWGLLDPAKAIRGPGMFYGADFHADVSEGVFEFSNDISGDAGLVKSGAGTLVLSGHDTYTGGTVVLGGELQVTGTLAGQTLLMGGVLEGNGSTGKVENFAGTVSTALGSLNVRGDYVQGSGATLAAYVGNTLLVDGTASLAGALDVKAAPGRFITTGHYALLTAHEGLSGDFQTVSMDSVFLAAQASRNSTTYSVDVTQLSTGSVAGLAIDGAGTVAANAADTLFSAANSLAAAQAAGVALTSAQEDFLSTAAAIQQASSVKMAQAEVDSHAGSAYAQIPQALLQTHEISQQVAIDRVHDVLGASQGRSGVWASGSRVRGTTAPTGWNAASSEIDSLSLGVDAHLDERTVMGGYVDQANAMTKFDRHGGTLKANSVGAGVYGKSEIGNLYVLGVASLHRGDANLARTLITTVSSTAVDAATRLASAGLHAELGYKIRFGGNALLSPYAGIFHDRSTMKAFQDNGGGSGLSVSDLAVRQSGLLLGLRGTVHVGNTTKLSGYIARRHVMSRAADGLTAAFNIQPSATYQIAGPMWERSSLAIGASITANLSKASSIYLHAARQESGDSRFTSFAAGYRYSF